jgi:hypothetical protein
MTNETRRMKADHKALDAFIAKLYKKHADENGIVNDSDGSPLHQELAKELSQRPSWMATITVSDFVRWSLDQRLLGVPELQLTFGDFVSKYGGFKPGAAETLPRDLSSIRLHLTSEEVRHWRTIATAPGPGEQLQ